MLIQGRHERVENSLMNFKWEVTWTHGNQPNTFEIEQLVNSHFVFSERGLETFWAEGT